jgi:hypothetical protein
MHRRNSVGNFREGGSSAEPDAMWEELEETTPQLPSGSRFAHREMGGKAMQCGARAIAQYPLASLVAGFSVGFGLGVLGVALLTRAEETWVERQSFPRSLHDLSEGLRRVSSMVAERMPDPLARH